MIDKEILNAIKPTKLRTKNAPSRPRPKTIHGDASADLDSGVLTPSRGKKGSSSNLSTGKTWPNLASVKYFAFSPYLGNENSTKLEFPPQLMLYKNDRNFQDIGSGCCSRIS